MASPGTQAATRTDPGRRNSQNGGQSTGSGGGAGTNALLGAQGGAQAQTLQQRIDSSFQQAGKDFEAAHQSAGANALLGPATPGAPGDVAPTITRTTLPAGVSPTPSAAETYDRTGRLKTMGTSPYVSDPSIGQLVGAGVAAAPVAGTLNALGGVAARAINGDSQTDTFDGGMIGRMIDGARGVSPGPTTGYSGNSVASSDHARGARPSDDSRIMDRAGAAATAALLGDGPDSGAAGTDALFSDVQLADRRKRSDFAGTNMLLKAA